MRGATSRGRRRKVRVRAGRGATLGAAPLTEVAPLDSEREGAEKPKSEESNDQPARDRGGVQSHTGGSKHEPERNNANEYRQQCK